MALVIACGAIFTVIVACAIVGALHLQRSSARREKEGRRRLRQLLALRPSQVRRITVFDRYGEEVIAAISSRDAIREFTEACRDVRADDPSHPGYWETWYVVVEGQSMQELECSFARDRPGELLGHFAQTTPKATLFYGAFASVRLRGWFEKYVVTAHPELRQGQQTKPVPRHPPMKFGGETKTRNASTSMGSGTPEADP